MRYDEMCAAHRWDVPRQYNIAADVCDKHPRAKAAMVWESFDGAIRELTWGELQDLANAAAHRLRDSEARLVVTDEANAPRFDHNALVLDEQTLANAPTDPVCVATSADDAAQLYYTSGTTGLAKGIVHAHRYILAHEEFVYCHEVEDGERFHGMGEWAWAAGIC